MNNYLLFLLGLNILSFLSLLEIQGLKFIFLLIKELSHVNYDYDIL